jgi:hypothetical protein
VSCTHNSNRGLIAAARCGINRLANKATYTIGANRDALLVGGMAGTLAFAGKSLADRRQYERQSVMAATYKTLLTAAGHAGGQAASVTDPQLRGKLLGLARNRLDVLQAMDYAGLDTTLRDRFRQQHQLVDTWLSRTSTVAAEPDALTRAFVLGAAKAGALGMKGFTTPTPPPPAGRTALQSGLLVGVTAAGLVAARSIALRRRETTATASAGPPGVMRPVENSSLVSAAGYDAGAKTLHLTFKSGGTTYAYRGVPPDVAGQFLQTDRKGAYFHQAIKGRYPFRKLETR